MTSKTAKKPTFTKGMRVAFYPNARDVDDVGCDFQETHEAYIIRETARTVTISWKPWGALGNGECSFWRTGKGTADFSGWIGPMTRKASRNAKARQLEHLRDKVVSDLRALGKPGLLNHERDLKAMDNAIQEDRRRRLYGSPKKSSRRA